MYINLICGKDMLSIDMINGNVPYFANGERGGLQVDLARKWEANH